MINPIISMHVKKIQPQFTLEFINNVHIKSVLLFRNKK